MGLIKPFLVPLCTVALCAVSGLMATPRLGQAEPANVSGGQKQHVAIARALVGNSEIVFADEPTAGLDKDSGRVVVDLLRQLGSAREMSTLMVTHDNQILDMADRILTMQDGCIV